MLTNFDSELFVESREYTEKNKNATMTDFHYHDFYEIYFLISGRRKYLINYNAYDIEAGDIVLINKKEMHMATELDGSFCERIVIHFNEDYVNKFGEEFKALLECFKLNHIKMPEVQKKNMSSLFSKILKEYNSDSEFSKKLTDNYIYELLVTIYRYISFEKSQLSGSDSNGAIDKAIRYIYNNYQKKMTLSEISKICHMNPSYFSRLFKKTTGISLVNYINAIKINKACSMLVETDMSVLEISQKCGYESLQHFCEMFKSAKGVSAGQFRKERMYKKEKDE